MVHDREMHAHHGVHDDHYTMYPSDMHPYSTSSDFVVEAEVTRQRYPSSDAFAGPHMHHDQHEAEHVYNSPQLTLDPSTLDLRSSLNEDSSTSSANPTGSNNTTPTGSLRLAAYNLPNFSSPGNITRRKARTALGPLRIPIQAGLHPDLHLQPPQKQHHPAQNTESQHQPQHQPSDMHDVQMHSGELQVHIDGHSNPPIINSIGHEHSQMEGLDRTHNMYAVLTNPGQQSGYYMGSEAYSTSPTSAPTPADASPHSDVQTMSPTSSLTSPTSSSAAFSRTFRSSSLSMGMPPNRTMSLVSSSSSQGSPAQPSSSHQLSSHPHMHPTPYYPLPHTAGSPGFPSTPSSHHAQTSSSSSHSSGQTRYSFRGSPAQRNFGRGHTRSNSYGTASTTSVGSNSPTNSVASVFTSLSGSGAGGSAPSSTTGPVSSPISYGDTGGDIQMPFATSPSSEVPHISGTLSSRAQSHPPLSMPTAHPALACSALLHQPRKSYLSQSTGGYPGPGGGSFMEDSRDFTAWSGAYFPSSGPRLSDEEFQAQYPPRPTIMRTPHRKQKLANSDRKAICMYAKQHPSARQEDIAARYNVERSTISKILKNKERWLGCPDDDAKVARKRKPRFDDLELVLKVWVEETRPQKILLSDALIRSKAKEEARRLGIPEDKFKASSGWLENFKHRVGVRKGKYVGREHWQEASESDREASPSSKLPKDQPSVWTDEKEDSSQSARETWSASLTDHAASGVTQAKVEDTPLSPLSSGTSESAMNQMVFQTSDTRPPLSQQEQVARTADVRPGSEQAGGGASVGMRKTRSRTLAEAHHAEAITGPEGEPPVNPGSISALATVPSTIDRPNRNYDSPSRRSHKSSSSSSTPGVPADSRDASAGLDAAIDFIDSQPQGFATPEEVAVLKKLSRRMSRADMSRHDAALSGPSSRDTIDA